MHFGRLRTVIGAVLTLACVSSAAAQWQHLGALTSYERSDTVLTLHCGPAAVRVEAVSDSVVRIRLAPQGEFGRDLSWAVNDLSPKARFEGFEESPDRIRVAVGGLTLAVRRDPCRLEVHDRDGHVLTADDPGRGMAWAAAAPLPSPTTAPGPGPTTAPAVPATRENTPTAAAVRVWQHLPDETAIYGLGEKTGPLDKNGRAWTMWNTDTAAYGPSTDPLYKSVPFFIVAREGRYHGVFLDNPWRTSFDFGQSERNILTFGAEGGELNYYVIAGPDPKDVIRRYTELTGRMDLPPRWALGYQQCRYSYYPEARVREIATTFRQKRIPCDVLYFDIDYMDGYRCFTWHPKWFPQPKTLMDDLHQQGFHTVAIIDPGIKHEPGYFVYDEGTRLGAWVTQPDGQAYVGRVWPGESVFPDFTNPKVRDWWAGLFPPFLEKCGLDGIWNDMNEPADFAGPNHTVPLDLRFDNAGEPASHLAAHNVYGMLMARGTREGLQRARPGRRVFTLSRATYAGGQRYGAYWTGDNVSTWEHLGLSLTMVLGLGASGMPFVGSDIGGFVAGASPELYARWIQLGSLMPFCRTHTSWPNPDQEPWSFGPDVEAAARLALERRYALLPYLYTLFEESSRTGLPIVRPLWMEFPETRSWYEDEVFLLGRDLYVAPILWPAPREYTHRLPPGVWFDAHTGLIYGGGQRVTITPDLNTLPLFVRAGAIIPLQSPVQSTTEAPAEPLILDVWPFWDSKSARSRTGWLYEDDGETEDYRHRVYRRTQFECGVDGNVITLQMRPVGTYKPPARSPVARFHGLPAAIERVGCGEFNLQQEMTRRESVSGERVSGPACPIAPGSFCFDAESGTWLVRMLPDRGPDRRVGQTLRVELGPPAGIAETAVSFDFGDATRDISQHREMLPPLAQDGKALLRIRGDGAYVVLPRLRLSADKLPVLRLRMSTESTTQVKVRFATEQDPTLSDRAEVPFAVTADGQLHEYTVDLAQLSGGRWTGTVYWVRLDFAEGARAGEVIGLDELSFEARGDPEN